MNRILHLGQEPDTALLRRKAKRVKNPQDTECIIAVQTMKKLALDWEQRNPGNLCAGLAAPQIGVNLRIIIVRNMNIPRAPQDPRVLKSEQMEAVWGFDFSESLEAEMNCEAHRKETRALRAYQEWMKGPGQSYDPFLVMYNPVYVESEGMQDSEEGCLSVPGIQGITMRPEKSTFHYYDHAMRRVPKEGELIAEGFSACVLNHELMHLVGNLYTDSAYKLWDAGTKPPEDAPAEKDAA